MWLLHRIWRWLHLPSWFCDCQILSGHCSCDLLHHHSCHHDLCWNFFWFLPGHLFCMVACGSVSLYIILCYKKVLFIHPFDINIVALWRDPHRKVLYRMKRNNNASKIKHYYWCTNICNHMSSICHNQLCLWMMELYSNDKIFLLNMDILETEN